MTVIHTHCFTAVEFVRRSWIDPKLCAFRLVTYLVQIDFTLYSSRYRNGRVDFVRNNNNKANGPY